MATPQITTKRLILRPYYASMVKQQHVDWLNDPLVVRYSEQRHQYHTLESQHSYVNLFNRAEDHIWLISTKDKLTDIGSITAFASTHNKRADIGILIGERSQWGSGYATEAWRVVMNTLFGTGIRKIEGGCMVENFPMRNVFKHVGMTFEGMRHNHFILDETPTGLMLYGVYK